MTAASTPGQQAASPTGTATTTAPMPASPLAPGQGETAAHLAHHQDISTYFKREAERASTLEGLVRQLQADVADLQKRLDHVTAEAAPPPGKSDKSWW